MKKNHSQKGFALLFAVLLAALLLSIGLSIFNLSLKEVQIAGAGKQSQSAFYAADAGIECVLYWDAQTVDGGSAFSTTTMTANFVPTSEVSCGDTDISKSSFNESDPTTPNEWSNLGGTTSFEFQIEIPGGNNLDQPCVSVVVEKSASSETVLGTTTISASGRNNCDSGARRVERGLRVSY